MPAMKLKNVSKFAVVVAISLGLGMIALGSIFVVMGLDARGDVRDALAKEQVVTSQDAPIPGVPVEDAATAKAQQDAIESHTFGRFGPYSSLDKDDPRREPSWTLGCQRLLGGFQQPFPRKRAHQTTKKGWS